MQGHDGRLPISARLRCSRRSLLHAGLFTPLGLLGLGSGMTTALAQRQLHQQSTVAAIRPRRLSVQNVFLQHQQLVRAVTWAPDEKMIASGGNDHLALVWKPDGTVLTTLPFPAPVSALAWSPDGVQLAAGAATIVSFFDAQTGALLAQDAGHHTASITSLGWTQASGTELRALSAGTDTRAIVWSGQSHQPVLVFRQHTSAIEALAVGSDDGLVSLWYEEGTIEYLSRALPSVQALLEGSHA